MSVNLKYVGGGDWLPGVPARDIIVALTSEAEDVREAADLVVLSELDIDCLVVRYKGDAAVLDADEQPVPTGLYERVAAGSNATGEAADKTDSAPEADPPADTDDKAAQD